MDETFSTSDIYIAAMLRTAGLNFIGVAKNGPRGIFKFEDSPERERLIIDFYNGRAMQDVKAYVDHWMNFKKMVENIQ